MEQKTFVASLDASKANPQTGVTPGDFGLLDVLIVCAENLRLLIIGPIVAAVISFGAVGFIPKSYTSVAYLGPLDEGAAKAVEGLVRSPVVLDAVLQKYSTPHENQEARRQMLEKAVSWSIAKGADRKSRSLYTLAVSDNSPGRAQAVNTALIDAWLEATKPPHDARMRLETQLARSEIQLKSVSSLIGRLEKETPTLVIPGFELASPLATLLEMREKHMKMIDDLKVAMAGISRDVIVVPPSAPITHTWPSRRQFVGISAIATWCLLLLLLLLRHALRVASTQSDKAPKLARLRAALWPWPGSR